MEYIEIRHAHLFCGLGGGAKGFNQGGARYGNLKARFRCLGGVDVDKAALADFARLTGCRGTYLDMFDREQYIAFHGQEPPADWSEATPEDLHQAFGYERPHIGFLSPPCKGLSGLLSEAKSASAKYQALNRLTLRGIWLLLEAYKDDPIELLILENVPRIATRGRHLLDQIAALLRAYGYAVAETTHDCGELGVLAQSRKRFLLVARHKEKVPSYLYEPHKRPLRAVGDMLGRMPMPGFMVNGAPIGGAMHRIPKLQWKTWVRLAFVEAGSDWRSLKRLAVENGFLRDFGIMSESSWRDDVLGVLSMKSTVGTITGKSSPTNGRFAVADPRARDLIFGKYVVVPFDAPTSTACTGSTTGQRVSAVAALHTKDLRRSTLGVIPYDMPLGTITSRGFPLNGAFAVADPLPGWGEDRQNYVRGHYGVVKWNYPSYTISANMAHDNGYGNIADPRLPGQNENCVAIIRSLDGTWHRPFTTLELAVLQGLLDPEEHLELEGLSDAAWRERIGNAVPPPTAAAIAGTMGKLLLLTWSGETISLGSTPIWVQPIAAALMAAQ